MLKFLNIGRYFIYRPLHIRNFALQYRYLITYLDFGPPILMITNLSADLLERRVIFLFMVLFLQILNVDQI